MKPLYLSKLLSLSVLTVGLVSLPAILPTSAQTTTGTDTTTENRPTDGNYADGDWGLLGLLGLFGLLGRRSRSTNHVEAYRDPEETSSFSSRNY